MRGEDGGERAEPVEEDEAFSGEADVLANKNRRIFDVIYGSTRNARATCLVTL